MSQKSPTANGMGLLKAKLWAGEPTLTQGIVADPMRHRVEVGILFIRILRLFLVFCKWDTGEKTGGHNTNLSDLMQLTQVLRGSGAGESQQWRGYVLDSHTPTEHTARTATHPTLPHSSQATETPTHCSHRTNTPTDQIHNTPRPIHRHIPQETHLHITP